MLKRFSAILLATLVFATSTGYSISAHLCGGKAVSYSLFGRPADCGAGEEDGANDHCEHPAPSDRSHFDAQKCCSDQTVIVPGLQHIAELAKKTIALPPFIALMDAVFCFSPNPAFASSVKPRFADYHPPSHTRNRSVLFQVFRI
jgi:hypothetical protein